MSDLYEKHNLIRNKIKTYDPQSIIDMAISIFHTEIDHDIKNWAAYPPWFMMLLIRWTFQYSAPRAYLKKITIQEFNILLGDIWKLQGSLEYSNNFYFTFMKGMFCQLPYQIHNEEIYSSIGRQLIIFNAWDSHSNLGQKFKEITHINIIDFLKIYFACWSESKNKSINGNKIDFSKLVVLRQFPKEDINKFFLILSLDIPKGKRYIEERTQKNKDTQEISYQLYEHTPLERYPFIITNNIVLIYSSRLLDNSIMYNIYDIFRENNSNFSGGSFGSCFENYVAKGVEYAELYFLVEKEIKKLVPKRSKTCDFFIQENGSSILIDAKSTSLHPYAKALASKEVLLENMKENVVYGIIQVIETAYNLRKAGHIDPKDQIYGIVVTYKDYLIGPGNVFWENVAGEYITQELNKLNIENYITPKNLFIITIEEFDFLMAGIKEKSIPLSDILLNISQRNTEGRTMRLMFKQHLRELWGKYFSPEYVKGSYSRFIKYFYSKKN